MAKKEYDEFHGSMPRGKTEDFLNDDEFFGSSIGPSSDNVLKYSSALNCRKAPGEDIGKINGESGVYSSKLNEDFLIIDNLSGNLSDNLGEPSPLDMYLLESAESNSIPAPIPAPSPSSNLSSNQNSGEILNEEPKKKIRPISSIINSAKENYLTVGEVKVKQNENEDEKYLEHDTKSKKTIQTIIGNPSERKYYNESSKEITIPRHEAFRETHNAPKRSELSPPQPTLSDPRPKRYTTVESILSLSDFNVNLEEYTAESAGLTKLIFDKSKLQLEHHSLELTLSQISLVPQYQIIENPADKGKPYLVVPIYLLESPVSGFVHSKQKETALGLFKGVIRPDIIVNTSTGIVRSEPGTSTLHFYMSINSGMLPEQGHGGKFTKIMNDYAGRSINAGDDFLSCTIGLLSELQRVSIEKVDASFDVTNKYADMCFFRSN